MKVSKECLVLLGLIFDWSHSKSSNIHSFWVSVVVQMKQRADQDENKENAGVAPRVFGKKGLGPLRQPLRDITNETVRLFLVPFADDLAISSCAV